jgi:carbon-monoxide dehydrogenase medium subunit
MYPAPFEYHRPATLEEALALLAQHGEDAKLLAGGHSLIPAMKLRLARPRVIVDIGRVDTLRYARERDGMLAIGAMTTHHDLESSALVRQRCPLLAETARHIGDVQVRNKGTIGGSLAHADPAADWPAAMLALDADLEIASRKGRRTVKAGAFFVDLLQTTLAPGEVLCEIRVPVTTGAVAYEKTDQKASGFALTGVAVAILDGVARVGVTGVAAVPYRAVAVERALGGGSVHTPEAIGAAAAHAADSVEVLGDIHASPDYRRHLAVMNTKRALTRAYRSV